MRNIVRNRSFIALITVLGVVALLGASIPASAAPPLPGAIFTTNSTCTGVDLNIYADKADVFLNGGPQNHPGAAGLTDGSYYVQVTTPGGTVLGSSVGTPNETPVQVVNGVFSQCYQLASIVATTSSTFTVAGYDDTTNPGGEYKVWVSNESSFVNNSTKTDNFKVRTSGTVTISGKKFYDAALSGDPTQQGIQGWKVSIYGGPEGFVSLTTTTDANGNYEFANLQAGTYAVCELLPSAAPVWIPTSPTPPTAGTPATYTTTVPPSVTSDDFGNVCLGAGGGLTLGFWSNKNGQALITAADLCFLNSLNLVNKTGATFDPVAGCPSPTATQVTAGKTALKNWLLSATATNMAYMLSAQLAAMELNVARGFVDGTSLVYAPAAQGASLAGLITINGLMADANTSLGLHPNTTSAGTDRTYQEGLKNALDAANNNLNFVQSQPCAVNYTAQDVSCAPAQ